MSDNPDLTWLVDRRSKIQSFLLQLYEFDEKHSANLAEPQSAAFQLLVGAAFSLWRAAFLADGDRSPARIREHAKEFLLLLVRDNSINYTQDRQTRAWTAGYYLNNTYFRLQLAYQRLSRLAEEGAAFGTAPMEAVNAFLLEQAEAENPSVELRDQWDTAYEAAFDIFKALLRLAQSSEGT